MILSIHKVPACPFTGLYTVSHCTDDHISCVSLYKCVTQRTPVLGCESLVYVKGPSILF